MSGTQVEVGDKVSWNWNGNRPSGTVGEVKAGEVTVTSHRGNEISKTGDSSDPAVHIERSGNDVVKTASELKVESHGSTNGTSVSEPKAGDEEEEQEKVEEEKKELEEKKAEEKKIEEVEKKEPEQKEVEKKPEEHEDEAKAGEKRKAEEKTSGEIEKAEENGEPKKQKTTNGTANGTAKKGPGRPKGSGTNGEKKAAGGAKKEKKVPTVGRSERKTRSQGTA